MGKKSKYSDQTILRRSVHDDAQLRAQESSDGTRRVSGYAVKWGDEFKIRLSDITIIERFQKGAFAKTINDKADVRLQVEHQRITTLARVKNGSLRLKEDNTGLYYEADLPDTQDGKDVHEKVRSGLFDGSSVGFIPVKFDEQTDRSIKTYTIIVKEAKLPEISLTPTPAFQQSTAEARAMKEYYAIEEQTADQNGDEDSAQRTDETTDTTSAKANAENDQAHSTGNEPGISEVSAGRNRARLRYLREQELLIHEENLLRLKESA